MANFNWLEQWRQHGRSNGHSVFDLSKNMAFHLPNSLIMPIRFIETVPDDHIQININGLLRTETMNRAAFYKGKALFSAFFVPYKQLWHNFNQFVVQKDDKHSTRYQDSQYAPVVDLKQLYDFVAAVSYDGLRDEFGYRVGFQMAQLLQYCKLGNIYTLLMHKVNPLDTTTYPTLSAFMTEFEKYSTMVDGKKVNIFRLLAYQHIFYDFYRNKYYDDTPYYSTDAGATTIPYIDTFNVDDIVCGNSSNNQLNFSYLGIDDEYEGWFSDASSVRIANILKPHYCQYRKDLFTSLLPSSQFGAVSGLSFTPDVVFSGSVSTTTSGRYVDSSNNNISGTNVRFTDGVLGVEPEAGVFVGASHYHDVSDSRLNARLQKLPSSFDVLQLRKAEVLQQWKQNALRAGNMVDDNFESHYGVKPFYEDDNNVRFLGQWECRLDVNPVTATAVAGGSKIGDLGAYGVGSFGNNPNNHPIDFQIKDFGVVVICAHFSSECYYSANGIDKQNTLIEPFDFFQSEFENSGLDTVQAFNEATFLKNFVDVSLGFTPAYTYLKTETDETFGEYASMPYYLDDSHSGYVKGSLSSWTVRRSDFMFNGVDGLVYFPVLSVNRFYQSPGVTDSIFGITYNGLGNTDPFGFALSIECKAIRPMSVLGIPIFG